MILDTDIHNFYEHLVLKEIEKQDLQQKLTGDQMADLCCLTLNQLPSHYIRHDVDMIYFLTDAKRTEMEKLVVISLKQALQKIEQAPVKTS
ncbi:TPA: late competence development ComFB family protein [Aeromonas veronii]|nr:late competence development ComFB family protein [Aeromonas allosaccharophila]